MSKHHHLGLCSGPRLIGPGRDRRRGGSVWRNARKVLGPHRPAGGSMVTVSDVIVLLPPSEDQSAVGGWAGPPLRLVPAGLPSGCTRCGWTW